MYPLCKTVILIYMIYIFRGPLDVVEAHSYGGIALTVSKQQFKQITKSILGNAGRFAFSLVFITLYQMLFGTVDVLAGVAISVGLTMFPVCPPGIHPAKMAGIIVLLYAGAGLAAQCSIFSPWVAFPIHFLFVALIMTLCTEPIGTKLYINFLLTFVFCQATLVTPQQFPKRLFGLVVGGTLVAVVSLIWWKHKGLNEDQHTVKEQIRLSWKNPGFILRMATGISVAMLIGSLLGLKKPLWISIVAMSLTQPVFRETLERIKHRALGTIVGIAVFIVVFRILVPPQYSMLVVLLMGYLSYFAPEYKHKQMVNAVSALNASLVLLDTSTAIENRCLCLLGGIVIVVLLELLQVFFGRMRKRRAVRQTDHFPEPGQMNAMS